MCGWVSDLACCHFAYALAHTIVRRCGCAIRKVQFTHQRAGLCVCVDWRSCHLVFRLLFVFIAPSVCLWVCVAYSSFAHVRTTPQLGDFRVVLCFVTFSPFLSLNSSLADNSVVFRSIRVRCCCCTRVFYLVKIGFQPEPNRFRRVKENEKSTTIDRHFFNAILLLFH